MEKRLYGIRGAVCAQNTKESVLKNVGEMCRELFARNGIAAEDIVSIHFTMTPDLDCMNAAAALRSSSTGTDVSKAALFTSQEACIQGMMPGVVRVLVTSYLAEGSSPVHVYMNGAEKLRPDFSGEGGK
ncbi:MAG: chorismate mutase [Treponema sp.]|nr:chorismate mutase [Treponema sp.]